MRRLILHGYLLLVVVVLSPAVSLSADQANRVCAELWQRVGPLQEEVHGVPWSTEVPDGWVVSAFNVKSLHRSDGSRFVPNSIQESDCYLDRILPSEVRTAFVEGAQNAVSKSRRAAPSSLLEDMTTDVDHRLDDLFPSAIAGGVLLAFWDYFGFDYGIQGVPHPNPNSLEREAYSFGVYTERNILRLLWVRYLVHLGVNEAALKPVVEYLRKSDASFALPSSPNP